MVGGLQGGMRDGGYQGLQGGMRGGGYQGLQGGMRGGGHQGLQGGMRGTFQEDEGTCGDGDDDAEAGNVVKGISFGLFQGLQRS